MGNIQAGYPETQTELSLGTLAIDKQMICGAEGQRLFALKVNDGNNTLKTLARQDAQLFLKAENPNYSDCIPINEMVIQGVVKAVLRQI